MSEETRPRLLLVPQLSELEWLIKVRLETWADVAAYDAPGVGGEPLGDDEVSEGVAKRGLEEIERRDWDRCVVVADEFGVAAAVQLAAARPEVVEALALGHARLSNDTEGERPTVNREVFAALNQLARHDHRMLIRQIFKMTGGEMARGGYGEDLVDSYLASVPENLIAHFWETRREAGARIEDMLRSLDVPLLLARHEGCLLFTDDGFEDAVAAFPRARSLSVPDKPSTSSDFAEALEVFCREMAGARAPG